MSEFDFNQEIFDSRDVINRIQDLQLEDELSSIESEELDNLLELESLCQYSPDWQYGELIIRYEYFIEYIKELINDCYPIPKELQTNKWPWRHFYLDYDSAAEEAKQDYIEFNWLGNIYYIRA